MNQCGSGVLSDWSRDVTSFKMIRNVKITLNRIIKIGIPLNHDLQLKHCGQLQRREALTLTLPSIVQRYNSLPDRTVSGKHGGRQFFRKSDVLVVLIDKHHGDRVSSAPPPTNTASVRVRALEL